MCSPAAESGNRLPRQLKIVAYLHDQVAIQHLLAHLGLSPPEKPKPPPAEHEVVRVPVDQEGREMEPSWTARPA